MMSARHNEKFVELVVKSWPLPMGIEVDVLVYSVSVCHMRSLSAFLLLSCTPLNVDSSLAESVLQCCLL